MKKKIALIATGITLLFAFATAGAIGLGHSHNIVDGAKTESGVRCSFCNGTGFGNGGTSNFNCFACKGSGRNMNY